MLKYRTLSNLEEDYFRDHPDEIGPYFNELIALVKGNLVLYSDLKSILPLVYSIAARWVPGFSRFLPIDLVLGVVESIEIGFERKLKVDFKVWNWFEMVTALQEISEAITLNTSRERLEAMYAVLVVLTDIETYLTVDEFVAAAMDMPVADDERLEGNVNAVPTGEPLSKKAKA